MVRQGHQQFIARYVHIIMDIKSVFQATYSNLFNTLSDWSLGPKYKTLHSACEVLVVKNTMGEQKTF